MKKEQDWRLIGHEDYLYDKKWLHRQYRIKSALWDHDHCILCFEKFDRESQAAYCTINEQLWLCEQCFADFREKFRWESVK